MGDPGVGGILLLVVCVAVVLFVAIVAGLVYATVAVARRRRAARRDTWATLCAALGLEDVGDAHRRVARGARAGCTYQVALEPHARPAVDLALIALGADGDSARWITSCDFVLDPPLPISFAVSDERSAVPSTDAGPVVPGHSNPMADEVHRVTSPTPDAAVAILVTLGRGPFEAIEGRGWRVSFGSAGARLEREGAILEPAIVGEGVELGLRLVARLREAASSAARPPR